MTLEEHNSIHRNDHHQISLHPLVFGHTNGLDGGGNLLLLPTIKTLDLKRDEAKVFINNGVSL
jgi:hypothetical protein